MKKLNRLNLSELFNQVPVIDPVELGKYAGGNAFYQFGFGSNGSFSVIPVGDGTINPDGTINWGSNSGFGGPSGSNPSGSQVHWSDYQNFYDTMQTIYGSIGYHSGGGSDGGYTTYYDGNYIYAYADSDGHLIGSWPC